MYSNFLLLNAIISGVSPFSKKGLGIVFLPISSKKIKINKFYTHKKKLFFSTKKEGIKGEEIVDAIVGFVFGSYYFFVPKVGKTYSAYLYLLSVLLV